MTRILTRQPADLPEDLMQPRRRLEGLPEKTEESLLNATRTALLFLGGGRMSCPLDLNKYNRTELMTLRSVSSNCVGVTGCD